MNLKVLFPLVSLVSVVVCSKGQSQTSPTPSKIELMACQSGISCVEIYDEKNLAKLNQLCDSPFWTKVESCDTAVYKAACIANSEGALATWWNASGSTCNPGYTRFTEKEAAKEFLRNNAAINEAKLKTTSTAVYLSDIDKYCHVTLKQDFLTNTNFTARLDKGSAFLIQGFERPSFGSPAVFEIAVDRGTFIQSTKVPVDVIESNCSASFVEKASRPDYSRLIVKPMQLYSDLENSLEVCALAAGSVVDFGFSCNLANDQCKFSGDALQTSCGVDEAYGLNFISRALPMEKLP